MKLLFNQIKERLEDPFFELQYLGKEAIRQRTSPIEKYGIAPDNFRFIDWLPEDDQELIMYSFRDTGIGKLLLAATSKGICFLGFVCKSEKDSIEDFTRRFANHPIEEKNSGWEETVVEYCNGNHGVSIPLHMKGTPFQKEIWKQLVRIPRGHLSTYGSLAPHARGAQAIGMAVGANPVSYIVPCHRIVKRDGSLEGYHWGTEIKKQLLAYEFTTDNR